MKPTSEQCLISSNESLTRMEQCVSHMIPLYFFLEYLKGLRICLLELISLAYQPCYSVFSLTTNQPSILFSMTFQRSEHGNNNAPRTWRTSNYFYCTQASHNQILKPVQKNLRKNSSQRCMEKVDKKASQAPHNIASETSNLKANCTAHTWTSHPGTQL